MGVAAQARAATPARGQKATALKGWIAARNGDDKTALGGLAQATRPTLRLAYALALTRANDEAKARAVFDELARRMVNDLEGALTRPRAAAWLQAARRGAGQERRTKGRVETSQGDSGLSGETKRIKPDKCVVVWAPELAISL